MLPLRLSRRERAPLVDDAIPPALLVATEDVAEEEFVRAGELPRYAPRWDKFVSAGPTALTASSSRSRSSSRSKSCRLTSGDDRPRLLLPCPVAVPGSAVAAPSSLRVEDSLTLLRLGFSWSRSSPAVRVLNDLGDGGGEDMWRSSRSPASTASSGSRSNSAFGSASRSTSSVEGERGGDCDREPEGEAAFDGCSTSEGEFGLA